MKAKFFSEKSAWSLLTSLLLAFLTVVTSGCGGGDGPIVDPPPDPTTTLQVTTNPTDLDALKVGDTITFTVRATSNGVTQDVSTDVNVLIEADPPSAITRSGNVVTVNNTERFEITVAYQGASKTFNISPSTTDVVFTSNPPTGSTVAVGQQISFAGSSEGSTGDVPVTITRVVPETAAETIDSRTLIVRSSEKFSVTITGQGKTETFTFNVNRSVAGVITNLNSSPPLQPLGTGKGLVELVDETGNTIALSETDATGHYRFGSVAPGKYKIGVIAKGIGMRFENNLLVGDTDISEENIIINFDLGPGAGKAQAFSIQKPVGVNDGQEYTFEFSSSIGTTCFVVSLDADERQSFDLSAATFRQ